MSKIVKDEYQYIEYEMYQNTKDVLFQTAQNKKVNFDLYHIAQFIYRLTLQNPNDPNFYNIVGELKQNYQMNLQFDFNTWSYQIKYKGYTFLFRLLAPQINSAEMQTELFSDNRCRRCHERAIQLFHQNQKLVTGYITDIQYPHLKTIHSWLEQIINNEEYVIDYVMNIIMSKMDYYKLMGIDKINELKDSNIIQIYQQTFLIFGRLYCLAGDEIAMEIKQKVLSNDIFSKI